VIARLIRKTLTIGVFAFIIGNYNNFAQIVYNSFAGLGIEAGGGTISAAQLLQPGKIAEVGIDAGKPILTAISGMMGFTSVFANLVQIVILLVAWLIVVIGFFVMAIQLFVSLIEFKLTTLAGFVLVPFGLFGRTAFLAEKVLGNVVSSGVKVMVLAVIIGIGSTIFSQFTTGFNDPPTISDALTLILAALSLLGLTIFGPGIANGLIAGGPQLGGRSRRRHGACGRRDRRRRRRCDSGGSQPGGRRDCRNGARRRFRGRRRDRRLPDRRRGGRRPGGGIGRDQPSAPRGRKPATKLRLRRACGDGRLGNAVRRRRCGRFRDGRRRLRRGPGLGPAHEAQSGHQPWRDGCRPRHPLRGPAERRASGRPFRGGMIHVSTTHRALRQDPRPRDAIPASRPGLGRAHRFGACRRRTGGSPFSARWR
jgi:P-type conjugative transfer protein TrbL